MLLRSFRIILVSILLTACAKGETVASYVNKNGYFRFDLPPGWTQLPKDVLDIAVEVMQEAAGSQVAVSYEAAFQPKDIDWFSGPYVFFYTNERGRIGEQYLKERTVSAEEIRKSLGNAASFLTFCGDARGIYDRERQAVYTSLALMPADGDTTLAMSCQFLTSSGFVAMNFYSSQKEWSRWRPTFDEMTRSARVDDKHKYGGFVQSFWRSLESADMLKWLLLALALAAFLGFRTRFVKR